MTSFAAFALRVSTMPTSFRRMGGGFFYRAAEATHRHRGRYPPRESASPAACGPDRRAQAHAPTRCAHGFFWKPPRRASRRAGFGTPLGVLEWPVRLAPSCGEGGRVPWRCVVRACAPFGSAAQGIPPRVGSWMAGTPRPTPGGSSTPALVSK